MTPSPNIEPKRKLFWKAFLAPIKQDIIQQMQNGPMPFKCTEKGICHTIMKGLIAHLDTILAPTVIAYLRAHPSTSKNLSAYDTLFSGTYSTILAKIEHFHAPTIIHILHKVRRFRNHFYETTQRIFQDWKQICTAFGIDDQDRLSEMILTSGDAHGEGAQTSIFRFSNHQKGFVYKPVSLNMEILLQQIRKIARKWQGINRDEPEIIAKNQGDSSYGYIGLYPYDGKVKSKQEAHQVYYNFGKLLAWGRFFKIADGHCDNIIINVPHVHWIDLESAFMFMEDIVYPVHPLATTGLLYEAKTDNTYIGIVTGIQGGTIPRLGLTSPTVYNDGRDDMFIRYFKIFYPNKIYNRIYQNGALCKPEAFTISIQKGYTDEFTFLCNKRSAIVNLISDFFKENLIQSRYILQATASYARFIGLIHHIMAHQKGDVIAHIRAEREKTIVGKEHKIKDFIVQNELIDLTNGVIPYFYRTNKNDHLYHISGAYRSHFFKKSLLSEIEDHVASLSTSSKDLEEDCAFIDRALQSTAGITSFEAFKKKFDFPVFDFPA